MNWFKRLFGMAKVEINGYSFSGDNVMIVGRHVYVDGQKVETHLVAGQQELDIKVTEGLLKELKAGGSVECGEVTGNVDAGGSISVTGNVGGNADAGGSIDISGNVQGTVDAGGSVRVGGSVSGDIDAGGSVRVGSK